MPKPPDLTGWLSYAEALQQTGIPIRTLQRRVQSGDIRAGYRRVSGRRPLVVMHPDDLQRELETMAGTGGSVDIVPSPPRQVTAVESRQVAPMPPIIDATATPQPPEQSATTAPPPNMAELLAALLERIAPRRRSRWVKLKEASEYSGLPQAYLLDLIHEKRLHAVKSGAWFVRTADLDRL